MRRKRFLSLAVLCGTLLGSAHAQTVGASLRGTVSDPTRAVVPGAAVEIRNVDTGATRNVKTDDGGRWREPILPPGNYELRVSATGFTTVLRQGIRLDVGQDATIDVNLEIGRTASEVTVIADAERVNLTSGSVSGLVDQKQMRDLPLNGRSFEQLALLQPGVNAVEVGGNDPVGGRTAKISINGTRPEQSSFLLDGTDINNVYNKTPGSVGGVLLGVEAVLEFQVLTNSYSAEFGRSAGGVINAVTRSGKNQVNGSLFEFVRNSKMDAKNFFDPATAPIPPYKRNQFGGVIGGPIRRDKTFFFGAFESLIERVGTSGVTNVPDANARATAVAAIQPYLALFPLPNGRSLGGGAAQYVFSLPQPANEYFAQGRVDHRFSERDTIFGRYTFDNGTADRPSTVKPPGTITKERSRNQYVTLEYQHVFTPALLNNLRAGYNRSTQEADNLHTTGFPSVPPWIAGQPFGFLTIGGLVTEAFGDYRLPRNDHLNTWQISDTVFLTKGRHGLRMGFEAERLQFNQHTASQIGGLLTFTSLTNFLAGTPSQMDFAVPNKVDPDRGYRQSLFAFYAQDDIRWRRNVTVNLGLRYEFVTVPTEVNGKLANLRRVTDTAMSIGDPWTSNPSLKNFAPRVGVAWDPFSNGKTSIRAGFGIFYDEILPKYYFFSGSLNPPFTQRSSLTNPRFPNLLAAFDPNKILFQLQPVNFDLQQPYTMQFNLSVQRALPGSMDITAGYAGSRGLHLLRIGDANLAPETVVNDIKVYNPAAGRRNPNFASITQRISDAQSYYNALQLGLGKRFSAGLRAQVSYTFSRSIDDSSGVNSQDYSDGSTYVFDYYDRKADRGLSNYWAQHVFVANWSYDLPFGKSLHGAAGVLVKGWQLNNVTTVQSGHPFEVRLSSNRSGNLNTVNYAMHERPDLRPGYSNNPILGGPDQYFDPSAFIVQTVNTRGNLGRNTLIGPGLVNVDFSVAKSFPLGEQRKLEFRAETFNLANHPNFNVPSGRTFPVSASFPLGLNPAGLGVISSTVTRSRLIQLGLKLSF